MVCVNGHPALPYEATPRVGGSIGPLYAAIFQCSIYKVMCELRTVGALLSLLCTPPTIAYTRLFFSRFSKEMFAGRKHTLNNIVCSLL